MDGKAPSIDVTNPLRPLHFFRGGCEKGVWDSWAAPHKLIEEHDDREEGLEEGLAAYGYYARGDDEDSDDADEGDSFFLVCVDC